MGRVWGGAALMVCMALGLVATGSILAAAAPDTDVPYRVIVHPANPIESLQKDDVSDLFLRKRTSWEDGTSVDPVDQSEVAPVRHTFSVDVHGKPVGGVRRYWQQRMFTGGDVPPQVLDSDQAVLAHVRANEGAVGYVSEDTSVDGVKVLEVVE